MGESESDDKEDRKTRLNHLGFPLTHCWYDSYSFCLSLRGFQSALC